MEISTQIHIRCRAPLTLPSFVGCQLGRQQPPGTIVDHPWGAMAAEEAELVEAGDMPLEEENQAFQAAAEAKLVEGGEEE